MTTRFQLEFLTATRQIVSIANQIYVINILISTVKLNRPPSSRGLEFGPRSLDESEFDVLTHKPMPTTRSVESSTYKEPTLPSISQDNSLSPGKNLLIYIISF